ncbi:MAG: response regulator [Prevotellaceae bacterium]|jgi:signal transduction histidine kinase/ligand-binding sensor domain-containing protein/DNA-binding response OmpR family regulator|nr:response regulator [Prevotellaceae bacterium]
MNNKLSLILILSLAVSCTSIEHENDDTGYSGHVVATDISNQQITSFAEDSLGHIWIGTPRGANKYITHEYHQYFRSDYPLSLCDNQIRQIYRDSKNRLWFATANGVCIYNEKDCFEKIPVENPNQNAIQILEDSEGRIFLNMVVNICEYKPEQNRFVAISMDFDIDKTYNNRCFADNAKNLWSVTSFHIRRFDTENFELKEMINTPFPVHYSFMRDNGELWLASENNLFVFDTKTNKFIETPDIIKNHPLLSKTVITYIHSYTNTMLLINTQTGLFIYDFAKKTVTFQSEDGFPFDVPQFKITTMFTDSQNNLWIGSTDQGYVTKFSHKEHFNNNNYLLSNAVRKSVLSVVTDKNDNLWIATALDGLFVYNAADKTMRNIDAKKYFTEKQIYKNSVVRLFVDSDNHIWLITEFGELIKCRYDGDFHKEKVFMMPSAVLCMEQDDNGTIYAAGFGENIYILRKGEKEFIHRQLYAPTFVFTQDILKLSTGELLVCSFNQNLRLINPNTWDITEIEMRKFIKHSLFIPTDLYEDSQGDIWIGTLVNGLFLYSPKTQQVKKIEETACSDISSINEDSYGNMWIGTQYGLSKYDRASEKITNYYTKDGTGGNQFYERSSCKLNDGTLIFGGTHGLTFFNSSPNVSKRNIPLLFEDLKIHNKLVIPSESECIDKHLSYNPIIRLNQNQNSFTISFAALDYSEYESARYYYIMEGFDKIWIDANNNREAYYSNLPAGKYTFRVKITDNNKSINDVENSVAIIVAPSLWTSFWAYCIYFLLAVVAIFISIKIWRKIKKEKELAIHAQREKEQEQRVNKMNMSFFSNISHEFRTPLTMISGPVTQLCDDASITGEKKTLLYIIQRSVTRMLKLVNQLLDFNKIENDTLKLNVKRTDVTSALARQIDIFKINANNKSILLEIYGLEDSFVMWLDVDKFEKITGNIMVNALKFTGEGGKIKITFDVIRREQASHIFNLSDKDVDSEYVKISVADSGIGIPKDKLEKIFERYFQLENYNHEVYNWGTGIGLYYTRCLIELHHGYIKADNRDEGGAVFTFILPVNEIAYNDNERNQAEDKETAAFPLLTNEQYNSTEKEKLTQQYTLLIVDDDTEVTHYLKTILSPYYKIIVRFDAASALEAVKNESPDLVLSDVVMPGSSGYELCKMIKEDMQSCHIPIILLTAKVTVESQVEGLDAGADAYVTKPFEPNYLLALIKSQLKNRENIRRILSKSTQTDKIDKNMLSPQDNTFMTELYELMENELSNTELNISRMIDVLKISRTKFYYKVKGLTGENPNVFFKTYKLNRAAELLTEGKYKISEVADMTGFSTLSHFSVSFKKQFGKSPSEYCL